MKKSKLIIGLAVLALAVLVAYQATASSPVEEESNPPEVTESVAPVPLRAEVTPEPETSAPQETPTPEEDSEQLFIDTDVITKFINVESANIRDTWSTEGNIVATYHLNDEILILGEGIPGTPAEGWSRITVLESPNYVYISTSLLSEEPIEVQAQPPVVTQKPTQKVEVPVQGEVSITPETPAQQPQQPTEQTSISDPPPGMPQKGGSLFQIEITEDSKVESNPDLTGITFN